MSNSNNKQQDKQEMQNSTKPDDTMGINVSGHILIRDKETGEELVNKRS